MSSRASRYSSSDIDRFAAGASQFDDITLLVARRT
jgi:hypothetical protein